MVLKHYNNGELTNWHLVRDHAFFHAYITNQDLLAAIERQFPGTRKKSRGICIT